MAVPQIWKHRCKEDDPTPYDHAYVSVFNRDSKDVVCELKLESGGKLVYDLPYPTHAYPSLHEMEQGNKLLSARSKSWSFLVSTQDFRFVT